MSDNYTWIRRVVVAVVLVVVLLSGPGTGIDLTSERPSLGDGTATVTVVQPEDGPLSVTDARFMRGASYVRIPDLVVDVTDVTGQPRVFYQVSIPALDVKKQNDRIVDAPGRFVVPLSDRAIPEDWVPDNGTTARVVVRVQSYSEGRTVLNRTVHVTRR